MTSKKVVTKKRPEVTEPPPEITKDTEYEAVISNLTADAEPPQPKPMSVQQDPAYKVFYCNNHYWDDVCKPHTLIVAADITTATKLLRHQLEESFGVGVDVGKVVPVTNIMTGVTIFSIGLGEIPHADRYNERPLILSNKTKANTEQVLQLFTCNDHYTSQVTPAATLIKALDQDEATLFLMQALKEIGIKDFGNFTVRPLSLDVLGVYHLTNQPPTTATDMVSAPLTMVTDSMQYSIY